MLILLHKCPYLNTQQKFINRVQITCKYIYISEDKLVPPHPYVKQSVLMHIFKSKSTMCQSVKGSQDPLVQPATQKNPLRPWLTVQLSFFSSKAKKCAGVERQSGAEGRDCRHSETERHMEQL